MPRLLTLLSACALGCTGLAAASSGAHAQAFISGAQLGRACASSARTDENACNGYIAGALDEVAGDAALKASVCPPSGVKLSVLREAVGSFAKKNPDETRSSGTALLHAMLKANYPCAAK